MRSAAVGNNVCDGKRQTCFFHHTRDFHPAAFGWSSDHSLKKQNEKSERNLI